MRDENGVFVGNEACKYLQGVDRMEERECCGGRKTTYSYVKCTKRGVVLAHVVCVSTCSEYDYGQYRKEGVS